MQTASTYPAHSTYHISVSTLLAAFLYRPLYLALFLSLLVPLSIGFAQEKPRNSSDSSNTLRTVTVTATRQAQDVSKVPVPVTVIDSASIREKSPNNAADLLREIPGVDAVGTGPNQVRPAIRGQQGQRILLLQDGLRLNNSRRQQDFGELPALVDVDQIERVEIVRGPASVLYGSDALGGVINLITRMPQSDGTTSVKGSLGYRYVGAGDQQRGDGSFTLTHGAFAFTAGGSLRNAGDYSVPGGRFGELTLPSGVRLGDSGVRDHSLNFVGTWRKQGRGEAWVRHDRYVARDAGFGFVEPRVLGDTTTRIQLVYPWQAVQKTSIGGRISSLKSPLANRVDISVYGQGNDRDFNSLIDVYASMGPGRTGVINSRSYNRTNVNSIGMRLEAAKVVKRAIFTYGVDAVRDDAVAKDSAWTQMVGFGPAPIVSNKVAPSLPDAQMSNLGVFFQADWRLHERFSIITGLRYHEIHALTRKTTGLADSTAGLGADNRTVVYAMNGIYQLSDHLSAVATWGTGFRAPNLIERYFSGPSTDNSAFQIANTELKPETSKNFDLGLRFNQNRISAEYFFFNSNLRDGIITLPTGKMVGRLAEFQNVNIEHVRTYGHEATVRVALGYGFDVSSNFTKVKTRNVDTPDIPTSGTYSSKLNVALGYRPTSGRFWIEGALRHQGEQKDINLGVNPIGDVLPAFTVMNVRGGMRVMNLGGHAQDISVGINNVANRLYAEAANSTFVRPEPGRNIVLSLRTSF